MKKDCCSEVLPQNCTRTFDKPASLVPRVIKDGWIQSDQRVLEIGSGCLRNAAFLLEQGFKVTAKELPIVIKKYEKNYDRFSDHGGRILTRSVISNKFDVVLSTFTLETICRKEERMELMEQFVESLKVGGRLVLSVRGAKDVKTATRKGRKCGDGYITPLKTFIKPFNVQELVSLLSAKVLSILKIYGGSKANEPQIIEIVAEKS